MTVYYEAGIAAFLFVLYWFLLSHLVDHILDTPRLKKVHWCFLGAFNTLLVFSISLHWKSALLLYLVTIALMLLEFLLFYRDKFSSVLLCTLACSIHILSVFMITVALLSLSSGRTAFSFFTQDSSFLLAFLLSFASLDLLTFLAIRLVPLKQVRLITQHQEQRGFLNAWMAVNSLFLLYLASNFYNPGYSSHLSGNQIAAALVSLISLYIVLFFSMKTSSLLGYKEKNVALEQAIQQEQQYRHSMTRDALVSYEINVTQDQIIKSSVATCNNLGEPLWLYSDLLAYVSQEQIHVDHVTTCLQSYAPANLLRLFANGQHEITLEYPRRNGGDHYIWVSSIIHLLEDLETNDVKAFIFIKDIDHEKRNQLELQRKAERDPLTGLYNKSMTAQLIDEHLLFAQGHGSAALFMIDVDNFKEINDYLGHLYGDAVLCELADKLLHIFKRSDIVGRIGGDEYMVFLKDASTLQLVEEKAMEIGNAFHLTYKGRNGETYTISSSIGISFFPQDASCFQDLYNCADIALYAAKSNGKNTYKLYDGSHFTGYTSSRTEIQTMGNLSQKGFRQNRIEYIFKILYQSESSVEAIHATLELVSRHFSFDRGYIFETSPDEKTTSNTFEWCAEGVSPEIHNLQFIPIEAVNTANMHFQENGTFILKSLDALQPIERNVLEPQGIKSMFQFGIFDKRRLLGFIGFDNCRSEAVPTESDIDEMKTICNILATFFAKQRSDDASAKELLMRQEILDHLDNYVYVINAETYEPLFLNAKSQALLEDAATEDRRSCYRFFCAQEAPCTDCPMHNLSDKEDAHAVSELYNHKLGLWMEASASRLRWTDGSPACLLSCTDITKQKEAMLSHIRDLEQRLYVDELTGCRSYQKFKEDAHHILEAQQDTLHLLVKLDIDNFKLINQIYGYDKGNEVLCFLAKAIENTLRNDNEIFARVTGDEFIALFALQDETEIESLFATFVEHFKVLIGDNFPFRCNFPHGRYLIYPDNAKKLDVDDMFEKANTAHKIAKLDKSVSFAFYDERMTKDALHAKEIENKMTAALENDEFTVYLQPKYELENEHIAGAEALTRWKNANMDLFFPDTFIPVFERNGFITKLDFHIFKKVCRIIKAWQDSGLEPVVVSVNFSRLHLSNAHFVQELGEIADQMGVDRKYLEIEITETVIYDNIDTLEILLHDIHENGFRMSMDDFGSGYSSLGMLKNLPVDVIKMDRSFFANQRDIERSKTVVGSVIQMASNLGIRIVAEGVEEQAQINFLRELRCDMVQGYYFAKPMPVDAFDTLLRAQALQETL